MSDRYALVLILAEDQRSANLLRRYVQRALHLSPRQIRQLISPSGRGDAKHWVLRRYALEVREMRSAHRKTALIAHLDADRETVHFRISQLSGALQQDGQLERKDDERIAHVIPRRHTETWLCILTGIDVDEERDCKREGLPPNPDQSVGPAARALFDLTRRNEPVAQLPSLAVGVIELRRLED